MSINGRRYKQHTCISSLKNYTDIKLGACWYRKDRVVGQTSLSHRKLCYLHANTFFAFACPPLQRAWTTGDTRDARTRFREIVYTEGCPWSGTSGLSSLSGALEVPLATARHAGGKRAQLMNSAMIAVRVAVRFRRG